MKSFKQYATLNEVSLEETQKSVVFCWGRFNPPTRAHEMVFDKAYDLAEEHKSRFYIFTSQTSDDDRNPLDYTRKINTLEKYFPKYIANIVKNTKIRTFNDVLRTLIENEYKKGILLVGEDRVKDFQTQIRKYFYDDIKIEVQSAGDRRDDGTDPTAIEEVSGQLLRDAAKKNDFERFKLGSPKGAKFKYIEDTFYNIRRRYGLSEQRNPEVNIEISKERNEFFNGAFSENDKILYTKTNQVGQIKSIGANHLNVQLLGETKIKRVWATEVVKL